MAKIQRLQRQEGFNKPIGIVTPSRAGVEAGENLERLGANMMQGFYDKAVAEETLKGEELAAGFRTRNDAGQVEYRQLPAGISKIAAQTAQPLLDRKYRNDILLDMKNQATRLRADHPNDPEGFDRAYSAYVTKTAEAVGDRHAAFTLDTGSVLAGENTASLYADKVNAEDEASFKSDFSLIESDMLDVAAGVESGELSSAMGGQDYQDLLARVDRLAEEHPDRLSVSGATEMKKRIRRAYGGALMTRTVNNVKNLPQFQDPVSGATKAASLLESLEGAYRTGNLDGMSDNNKALLKQAGFTEEMLSPQFLDAESRRIIAGDLSVIENNLQDILKSEASGRQAMATALQLDQGELVSSDKMENFLGSMGYTTTEDIINDLPNILNPKTEQHKALQRAWLHNNSDMPPMFKNVFSQDNLEKLANNGQLPDALDLYRQSTMRMNSDGSGDNQVTRGLSEDTVTRMESLIAYRNSVKVTGFEEYFQKRNELAIAPNRSALLKQQLGEESIADFVIDNLPSNATAEERTFHMRYAEDLVLMHGKDVASDILHKSGDKVFGKSEFTFGDERTRFAPEKAYPDKRELEMFKAGVDLKLELADGNYQLGKNAFLIPDPRHGMVNPEYIVVDNNKMPIMAGGKAIIANGQSIIEARARNARTSVGNIQKQMRAEQQRRLGMRDIKNEERPQGRINQTQGDFLDDIAGRK